MRSKLEGTDMAESIKVRIDWLGGGFETGKEEVKGDSKI
jgi:hypothetical protein